VLGELDGGTPMQLRVDLAGVQFLALHARGVLLREETGILKAWTADIRRDLGIRCVAMLHRGEVLLDRSSHDPAQQAPM
jgi:hypothetical protein